MLQFIGNPYDNLIHNTVHLVNDVIIADNLEFKISGMVYGKGYHVGMMDHPLLHNVQFNQARVSPIIFQWSNRRALSSGMLMFLG